jgi:hypothetical protein
MLEVRRQVCARSKLALVLVSVARILQYTQTLMMQRGLYQGEEVQSG